MGIEPVHRRRGGPFLKQRDGAEVVRDEMHSAVEFCDATRRHARGRAHLCNQKAAVFKGQKVVGHARFHGLGGKHKPRFLRIAYVKEENSILIFQQAEQSAASQDGLVRIQVAVVRFVADIAGGGVVRR